MLWSLEFGQMPYQCPVSVNAALPNPVCGEPCQVRMFVQASYFLLRFSSLASCSWRKSAKGKTCLLLLQTLKQDLFILSFLLRLLLRLYAHQLLFFGEKTRRKKNQVIIWANLSVGMHENFLKIRLRYAFLFQICPC